MGRFQAPKIGVRTCHRREAEYDIGFTHFFHGGDYRAARVMDDHVDVGMPRRGDQ